MNDNDNKQQGLQLELAPNIAQGEYVNFAIITHSSSDFVLDFARVLPGVPKAQVKSRVIMGPEHAKRLLAALQENIMRYEREYGPIKIPNQEPRTIAPFGHTKGEA
jgi:ribonuclease BN (tRNA processing enzyme)